MAPAWRSAREHRLGPAGRFARAWISSKLTPLIIAGSLLLGAFAVWKLPREEEPQIIVPMIDVFVADARRLGARSGGARHQAHGEAALGDPRRRVHLLDLQPRHVDGDRALPRRRRTKRRAIVRLNQKLFANFDLIPPGASQPLVKPRSIDDVPILALTLSSKRYGDFELRRLAAQLHDTIKQVPDVSAVTIIGGQRREVRVDLDEARLAGYQPRAAAGRRARSARPTAACRPASFAARQPRVSAGNRRVPSHAPTTCGNVVVGVADGQPGVPARRRRRRPTAARSRRNTSATARPAIAAFWPAVTLAVPSARAPTPSRWRSACCAAWNALRGLRAFPPTCS